MFPEMTDAEIIQEVRDYIEAGILERRIQDPAHVTQALIENHPDIRGKDRDFYLCCGYEHVRDLVREVLGEYKDSPEPKSRQLVFDGFEHLQKAYLIKRKGRQLIIPVEKCTDPELIAKATEYRKMAFSCNEHADEIDRYRRQRGGTSADRN